MEASTGIEPVYTDLQSALRRESVGAGPAAAPISRQMNISTEHKPLNPLV